MKRREIDLKGDVSPCGNEICFPEGEKTYEK
jgi:hypothetical protein